MTCVNLTDTDTVLESLHGVKHFQQFLITEAMKSSISFNVDSIHNQFFSFSSTDVACGNNKLINKETI